MTFTNNYFYDLPFDIINHIDNIKKQIEIDEEKEKKKLKVGDIFIGIPSYHWDGDDVGESVGKYQITKINKVSYQFIRFRETVEPIEFVKGETREETRWKVEHTYKPTIYECDKKMSKPFAYLEKHAKKSNPISWIRWYALGRSESMWNEDRLGNYPAMSSFRYDD